MTWPSISSMMNTVSDLAFKSPKGEPTHIDGEVEKQKLDNTVQVVTEPVPKPAVKKTPQPSKKTDQPEHKSGLLGSMIDAGSDLLGSVQTAAGNMLDNTSGSLLTKAEQIASNGLASIHGNLDANITASEPVLRAVDEISHPQVTFGLSQETMVFAGALTMGTIFFMTR